MIWKSIIKRIVIVEKYPHHVLRDIIKNKYLYASKQEYGMAAEYQKLEIEFFEKRFKINLSEQNQEYPKEFHNEKNMDKKTHMRIQMVLHLAYERETLESLT